MNLALLRLPRMQRYALSSIFALAQSPRDERPTSDEIADRTGAPRPMLTKVLRRLVVAGLIDGERGHHGGYRLLRAPDTILLEDVLAAVNDEGCDDPNLRECALSVGYCDSDHPCVLHDRWSRATDPLARLFATTTVAEVLRGQAKKLA